MHEKSCLAREAVASMEGLYGYTEVALELMIRLVQVHTWSSLENPVNDIKHPISSLDQMRPAVNEPLYYIRMFGDSLLPLALLLSLLRPAVLQLSANPCLHRGHPQ